MPKQILKVSLIMLLILVGFAYSGEWHLNKSADNMVLFKSSTTVLDFEGTTNKVDGYLYWEGDSILSGKNEIFFEVRPIGFETGLGKRDKDMREDVLETDNFPVSSFTGTANKITYNGNKALIEATGEFLLHGVKRKISIKAEIIENGNSLSVNSSFSILLKDYGIADRKSVV